ncbi:hypothetical protein [Streptomyces showdoensis]|uniref:Uncharacterized protein n=1 Tax=Streptomyces showdoensis TaxID=68268 RepID=A0A2P2GMC5_STREW|nr:hypothetical protein [Streptomyces showdoensis]KKZ72661.1 hypothetical protein VO63_17200 [Streptomyces showdoensis]
MNADTIALLSLAVAVLALGVAVVALVPARRSATASERSAAAAERAELAAVKAADRATWIQQEQATREAYRSVLIEFRTAVVDVEHAAVSVEIARDTHLAGDDLRTVERRVEQALESLSVVHEKFGPEVGEDMEHALLAVAEVAHARADSVHDTSGERDWHVGEGRPPMTAAEVGLEFGRALNAFDEAHRHYLTKDLSQGR